MLPPRDPGTLVEVLRRLARAVPRRRACVWLRDGDEEDGALTYAALDAGARAIAAALTERGLAGERALLVYTPGLEFVRAFLGCLYAGVTAVPASPPRGERGAPALLALARHAAPAVVLVDRHLEPVLRPARELIGWPEVLATDGIPAGAGPFPHAPEPGALAFVQYTSGSTGVPRGVEVTHAALVQNEQMIRTAFAHDERTVFVGWLPPFHDMGLVGNVLQPLFVGGLAVLMAPAAFVQKPVRWLRAVSRYRGTTGGAPDFAYDLCARKCDPAGLDLRSWKVAFDGSEPVRSGSLARFAARFAPAGFDPRALYPCYGLAEATLFVTGNAAGDGYRVVDVDREELAAGRVVPVGPASPHASADGDPGRRTLVGCGRPWLDQRLAIVDPTTRVARADGAVGEVWLSGGSVARGYRGLAAGAEDPFRARTADGDGPWLRTGDLGFLDGGQLFVTGRMKDVVVQRGRNHDPQDLEHAASTSHPALRPGHAAAFARADDDERLVLVQEVERRSAALAAADPTLRAEATGAVRAAVSRTAGLQVWRVVLVPHGALPRTSSGKVRRRACRDLLERGELVELAGPTATHA
jgi:acyl-CoA synthetase (AMP-forming)/AMP-acid ligase II